jgi:predicted outer membrane protein
MSASPKMRFGIAAAGLSCLFAGYVVAQQQVGEREAAAIDQPATQNPAIGQREGQNDRATTERREYTANFRGDQAKAGASNQEVQRYIAGCLAAKNQAEVEMGKFAQQQSQNPEVKEFAQMLVQDHTKLVQQLQALSGNQAGNNATSSTLLSEAGQDDAAASTTTTNAANRQIGGNSAVDQLLALDRKIVEKCTQSAKDALQQKQGAKFDKAYVGSQIHGHMQMLSTLEVLQQQGPEQIQQIAQQAHPKVKQHLDHAKQIMKQLEGDADTTGSREARQPSRTQPATQ